MTQLIAILRRCGILFKVPKFLEHSGGGFTGTLWLTGKALRLAMQHLRILQAKWSTSITMYSFKILLKFVSKKKVHCNCNLLELYTK